jgi:hypothetical protein
VNACDEPAPGNSLRLLMDWFAVRFDETLRN